MEHEMIIKREDGSKVKIGISLYLPSFRDPEYRVSIFTCEKNKRTWIHQDCDSYEYRSLPFGGKEREAYEHKFHLQFASEEEIHKAKLELWEKIKP